MLGWTIQTEAWWHEHNGRRVYGSWKFVDPQDRQLYRDFLTWLRDHGRWATKGPPIWAWTVYDDTGSRTPDLRCSGHLNAGTRGVRLEIEHPRGLAVHMCFQRWCSLMSDHSTGAAIADLMKQRPYNGLIIDEQKVYRKRRDGWGGQVQTILPYLDPLWIRKVTRFVAR